MARIITGRPLEKMLWIVAMLFIIYFTTHRIYDISARYLRYGVKSETQTIEEVEGILPVITLCLQSTLENTFLCYKGESLSRKSKCPRNVKVGKLEYKNEYGMGHWIEGKYLGHGCHVFNEHGTMAGYQNLHFSANTTENDTLVLTFQSVNDFIHKREVAYFSTYHRSTKLEKGNYDIYIKEKRISRLPYPYTSQCIDRKKESNMFSEHYTQDSCRENCTFHRMLEECHDVVDYWKKFLPDGFKIISSSMFKCPKNISNLDCRKSCMTNFIVKMNKLANYICDCRSACRETNYAIETQQMVKHKNSWRLALYKERVLTEEKLVSDFPKAGLLGSIGGIIGLGGKFQVVFQLAVFLFLCCKKIFVRTNDHNTA